MFFFLICFRFVFTIPVALRRLGRRKRQAVYYSAIWNWVHNEVALSTLSPCFVPENSCVDDQKWLPSEAWFTSLPTAQTIPSSPGIIRGVKRKRCPNPFRIHMEQCVNIVEAIEYDCLYCIRMHSFTYRSGKINMHGMNDGWEDFNRVIEKSWSPCSLNGYPVRLMAHMKRYRMLQHFILLGFVDRIHVLHGFICADDVESITKWGFWRKTMSSIAAVYTWNAVKVFRVLHEKYGYQGRRNRITYLVDQGAYDILYYIMNHPTDCPLKSCVSHYCAIDPWVEDLELMSALSSARSSDNADEQKYLYYPEFPNNDEEVSYYGCSDAGYRVFQDRSPFAGEGPMENYMFQDREEIKNYRSYPPYMSMFHGTTRVSHTRSKEFYDKWGFSILGHESHPWVKAAYRAYTRATEWRSEHPPTYFGNDQWQNEVVRQRENCLNVIRLLKDYGYQGCMNNRCFSLCDGCTINTSSTLSMEQVSTRDDVPGVVWKSRLTRGRLRATVCGSCEKVWTKAFDVWAALTRFVEDPSMMEIPLVVVRVRNRVYGSFVFYVVLFGIRCFSQTSILGSVPPWCSGGSRLSGVRFI